MQKINERETDNRKLFHFSRSAPHMSMETINFSPCYLFAPFYRMRFIIVISSKVLFNWIHQNPMPESRNSLWVDFFSSSTGMDPVLFQSTVKKNYRIFRRLKSIWSPLETSNIEWCIRAVDLHITIALEWPIAIDTHKYPNCMQLSEPTDMREKKLSQERGRRVHSSKSRDSSEWVHSTVS